MAQNRNPVADQEDFSAVYWSSIHHQAAQEAVVSGCDPSLGSGDFDVDVAAGEVVVADAIDSVSSGTVTLSAADTTDRVDIITVQSGGTLNSVEGTPAADADAVPVAPDIPADEVLIAAVLVEADASDLSSAGSDLADYRTMRELSPIYHELKGESVLDYSDLRSGA